MAVPESWLRRRVTARLVPCTRLGKHLRFSHADLVPIAAAAARPAAAAVPARRPLRGVGPRAGPAGGEPDAAQAVPLRAQTSVHIRYRHPPAPRGRAAAVDVGQRDG